MTAPRFVDEYATRQCCCCGRPTPVRYSYRLEHLRMIGWTLFGEADYVSSCGHLQRFLLVPHVDGEMGQLVPILGEAA